MEVVAWWPIRKVQYFSLPRPLTVGRITSHLLCIIYFASWTQYPIHSILRWFRHKDIGQSTVSEFHLYVEDMTRCVKSCCDALCLGQHFIVVPSTQHCWLLFHLALDDEGVHADVQFISPVSANPPKDSNIPQLSRRTTRFVLKALVSSFTE